ncbi:DNA-binding transcriptional regulator, CsgD family [Fodinibius roseus]|uniref:DNA-binding transcriptional regulator, CsgD family n=1 Tax=Fodinibius roseus TaxID=1194090 RepID=A0A1M5CQN5_9BACT|nr:transcriptional regulator [Fodinibius roseus]SHF56966.1 DNA-binding transcriptional regulator, CsgD family [Fodinibius roseus]
MFRDYFFLALSILLFIPCHIYGQSEADSLKEALHDSHGLQRAELLLELSGYTRQTDIGEAINQVEEAQSISERMGAGKLQIESLRKLGFYHSIQEQEAEALEYYFKALELTREQGYRLEEAAVLHALGRFYTGQENYSKALDNFFEALRIRDAEGDQNGSVLTLYYIGTVYDYRDDKDEASTFYKRAYELGREIKNYRQMSTAAAGIAILYQERDSIKKALSNYEKAMNAAERINSSHAQATILLHMSSAYQDQDLIEKAIALNNRQIEIARAENSRFLEAQGLENLAELYQDQGNIEQSNRYFREANSIYAEIGYSESTLITSNKLAQNFLVQERFEDAVAVCRETLDQAKASGSLERMESTLELLVQAYMQQGDYSSAFSTQEELTAVKDSLFNTAQEKQIAEMQTRYETEQKEQEIALLRTKQERAQLLRNALISGLILIMIIGVLIYNRQRLKIRKNRTELENTRLKEQKLEQDLAFKNRQLTTHSLHLVQKNETMKELKEYISNMDQQGNGEALRDLQSLKNLVDYSFNLDEDWEQFQIYFEEVHSGFFDTLIEQYPDLTPNELRLSALVKLNLTSKEIAVIVGITPDSVKTARYRLRKKLNMETEENLTEFMMDIEKEASET